MRDVASMNFDVVGKLWRAIACCAPLIASPSLAQSPDWYTFNGDLRAQKYSPLTQITPANVGKLKVAWRSRTGDVSDGSGATPATVWSATPLFVNETVYVGTPFYRIIAYEPDTGKQKWAYDSKATLKALTQPALKNRGVAYWQAAAPVAGAPCQKRVYIGTMQGTLHAVDADTGTRCADFGKDGVVDINQWNTVPKWPLSVLQPPTVVTDGPARIGRMRSRPPATCSRSMHAAASGAGRSSRCRRRPPPGPAPRTCGRACRTTRIATCSSSR